MPDAPSVTAGTIAFDLTNVLFTRAEGSSHGVAAQDDGVYAISGGIMVIVR